MGTTTRHGERSTARSSAATSFPPALGVVDTLNAVCSIDIAYPVGLVEHRRSPAKMFRLVVSKLECPIQWRTGGTDRPVCLGGSRTSSHQLTA